MRRVAVALKAITPKDKMIAGLLITILLEICGFGGLLVAVSGGGAVAGVKFTRPCGIRHSLLYSYPCGELKNILGNWAYGGWAR